MSAPASPSQRLGVSVLLAGAGSASVVAAGELDVETAPLLADTLSDTAGRARHVLLDLRALTFLDPCGAGQVCQALRSLQGRLTIVPPLDGAARRFLEVLRLEDALPLAA